MAVMLMTPMAGAVIAVGVSRPAVASGCPPFASATISGPAGTVTTGSTVHVSAQISGLMLLKAHLQISGPGLNKQVGNSVTNGTIRGDVTVPQAGRFTLAVIGNGTSCTYKTAGFSVKDKASSSKPTHRTTPGGSARPGDGVGGGSEGRAGGLPTGAGGSAAGGDDYPLNPLSGASPFSLPAVAPDGSGLGFTYPTPDPQVAAPPTQPTAHDVSQTAPIKWGQSLAIALVLLVISAHLGMWSRRQRLAAEAAQLTRGGTRTAGGRRRPRAAFARTGTSLPTDDEIVTGAIPDPVGAEAEAVPDDDPTATDASPATDAESVTDAERDARRERG